MKKFLALLLVTLMLAACHATASPTPPTKIAPPTETASPTETAPPSLTPTLDYKPCYYVWAYQDLPEITEKLQSAFKPILPNVKAAASAYGENCVAEDGASTFSALETDFYIRAPVTNLKDEAALGKIVEQALTIIIDQFSRPTVPGGQDGFVEFTFTSGSDQRVIRVQLANGKELLAKGLHGAELMKALGTK